MSPQVTTTVRNTTLLCKDNLCGWDGSWLPDSSQPLLAAHGSSPPAGARKTTPRLGFRHETAQKYSPILEWMAKIQLCLHDEAQQFGNLDQVAALARLPASCICIWTGDHKQTPGGLKKTPEAIAFRHKMMKRPIGLRLFFFKSLAASDL